MKRRMVIEFMREGGKELLEKKIAGWGWFNFTFL
jgi:hypothetical protein